MAEEKKSSGWKKAYLILRWPVALGLLGFAAIFFLVGLVNSLGYNGTTALRAPSSKEWKDFLTFFASEPSRGTPFKWQNKIEPRKNGELINFDRRLIKALEYLKTGSISKSATCGWNSSHELLTLDVNDNNSEFSSYTCPLDKPVPLSTIYRGVGLRISQADYIKCTIYPRNSARADECLQAPTPRKFPTDDTKGFPIPLASDKLLTNDIDYDSLHCRVTCGVDTFPLLAGQPDINYNSAISKLVSFDPKTSQDEYENIKDFSRQAARLKSVLIAYELMHIDDKNCATKEGNIGYDKQIPITMLMQEWVVGDLGATNWKTMRQTAEQQFPFNFQLSSQLAGLWYDKVLNVLGLHFNY